MRTTTQQVTRDRVSIPTHSLAEAGAALAGRPYARRGVTPLDRPVRVLLVDDRDIVRCALGVTLRHADANIDIIGDSDVRDAAAAVARTLPDIIVLDLEGRGVDDVAVTRTLAELAPDAEVIVLTARDEYDQLLPLLEAGVRGLLGRDTGMRELLDAIRVVATGDVYLRPTIARQLAQSRAPEPERDEMQFASLSARERSVLTLTAAGYNGPEVGAQLGITAKTVDTYKQRIEDKVGLSHRAEYVRFALRLGLLHAEQLSA